MAVDFNQSITKLIEELPSVRAGHYYPATSDLTEEELENVYGSTVSVLEKYGVKVLIDQIPEAPEIAGWASAQSNELMVNPAGEIHEVIASLIHEVAHFWTQRHQKTWIYVGGSFLRTEIAAEIPAYIVCEVLGIDTVQMSAEYLRRCGRNFHKNTSYMAHLIEQERSDILLVTSNILRELRKELEGLPVYEKQNPFIALQLEEIVFPVPLRIQLEQEPISFL
jgi:hypothetical protein